MTDAQHPITPPAELVQEWCAASSTGEVHFDVDDLAARAAQWGADAELKECCAVLDGLAYEEAISSDQLRSQRRPKPPSLKEQALKALLHLDHGRHNESCLIIRRALEQLDD